MSSRKNRRTNARRQQVHNIATQLNNVGGLQKVIGTTANPRERLLAYNSMFDSNLLYIAIQHQKLAEAVLLCDRAGTPLTREDLLTKTPPRQSPLFIALETKQLEAVLDALKSDPAPIKQEFFGNDPAFVSDYILEADWEYIDAFLEHFGESIEPADHFRVASNGRIRFDVEIDDLSALNKRMLRKGVQTSLSTITQLPRVGGQSILQTALEKNHIKSILSLDIENDEPIPVEAWVAAMPGNIPRRNLVESFKSGSVWEGRPRDLANAIQACQQVRFTFGEATASTTLSEVNAGVVRRTLTARPNLYELRF